MNAIAPLGPSDDPEWIAQTQKKAKKLRDRWLATSALALGCFAAGAIGAACAILLR